MPFDCCGTGVAPISFSRNFYRSDSQRSWIDRCDEVDQSSDVDHPEKFSNFFLMFKYTTYPSRLNCFFTCLIHQHNVVIKWTPYTSSCSISFTQHYKKEHVISSAVVRYTTQTSATLINTDHLPRRSTK
jgi:hypothetical protein